MNKKILHTLKSTDRHTHTLSLSHTHTHHATMPRRKGNAVQGSGWAAGGAASSKPSHKMKHRGEKKGQKSPPSPSSPGGEGPFWTQALSVLPAGSAVAIVRMVGSLCPVTKAHVDCFQHARRILLGEQGASAPKVDTPYAECIGIMSLNSDKHVDKKVQAKGQRPISYRDRHLLIEMVGVK